MKKFWKWTNQAASENAPAERVLFLNGTIAEESWFDDDITPQLFKEELMSGEGNITVWINSPGGDCVAAAQIYNMLMEYKGDVIVKIDGIAASAASVIAMAGTKVLMSPVSMMGLESALEEIRFCIYKKDLDKALKLMEALVAKYEELDMFADDAVSEYHNFRELFEEILYKQIHKPEKDVRRAEIDYSELYLLYGSLLVELKRYADAEVELKKAMQWNPSNASIAFEHAETFKPRGMMEEYYQATMDAFKIAFHPAELARCYRNLGYYFVEKKDYPTAVCCETFSLQFEKSDMVQSELYYISVQDKSVNIDPDMDTIENCFKEKGIPFGPDDDILGLAYQLTKLCIKNKNKESAEYFISIILGFFSNKELEEMYEVIQKM